MSTHVISTNKRVKSYNILFSKPSATTTNLFKSNCLSRNQRRRMRQKNATHRRQTTQREINEKFLKNFSSHQLTDNQVSMISKGLKFIPTPVTDERKIRHQLLQDFEQFARRMRLQYIFHGQNKEPHPFHVKSNWIPPVQQSVAFANIFMAEFETKLIRQSRIKPIEWKRYIDDVFSLWDKSKHDINLFIEQANQFHPSIKYTAEISENEITFLDTII